jgi:5-oxoprolinase (ATP-hydrolysing)
VRLEAISPALLAEQFRKQHVQEFGFGLENRRLLVDVCRARVQASSTFDLVSSMEEEEEDAQQGPTNAANHHKAFFPGLGMVTCPVYDTVNWGPSARRIVGPAVLVQQGSTVVVDPGCSAVVTKLGDVIIDVGGSSSSHQKATPHDTIQRSLFAQRFMSVAEQMGRVLRRTSVSVNIKERLDYSCGLFNHEGGLVAHAPYIPVHLGAMSAAVKFQIAHWQRDLQVGDVLVSNHPQLAGGSHLPDITVMTPAWANKKVVFWVASRAHHADIGGISAGSMPPHSKRLAEEGCAIVALKLVRRGEFQEAEISNLLQNAGTRNLKDNISDLKAQIAANLQGVRLIESMIHTHGLATVHKYMHAIQGNAEQAVRKFLQQAKYAGRTLFARDYMDDGSCVQLTVRISATGGNAEFDFTGTGVEVLGNWNAPRAVTLSAVVYCLRSMVKDEIPLNEGILGSISITIPQHSLLDPSPEAAVVGGNVLTSQRVVDVILKAFEACAASQGCMNNLSFGDSSFGYYETICGGAGAGEGWHGRSCVHTHMTNTRIGDPEIIEKRYPVIVRRFERRLGSGGVGMFNGGDGVVREIEFLRPVSLSVLTERRVLRPFGMLGGEDGACGLNMLLLESQGRAVNLGGKAHLDRVERGDVVRIETPGGGGWGGRAAKL